MKKSWSKLDGNRGRWSSFGSW